MEHAKTLLTLAIAAMVLTGFCVAPVVGVTPFVAIGGVELTLETGIVIAGVLGMVAVQEALKNHQADLHENLQRVSDGFTSWLSSLCGWPRADIKEVQKLFKIEAAVYNSAPLGPDGKKPKELKVWHEARVTNDGKNVEIKREEMTEEEAIKLAKQVKNGEKRGIFSPNREAADYLYKAITGKEPPSKPELHGKEGHTGYYLHYHIDDVHTSHIWMPKE